MEAIDAKVDESATKSENMRKAAQEQMTKAAAALAALIDEAGRLAMVEQNKAKQEAAKAASKGVLQARESHAKLSAEAASRLKTEQEEAEQARIEAEAQLEASRAEIRRLKALEEAQAEAAAAKKEAYARKAQIEADRRKGQDARTAEQHRAIRRRPGGAVLLGTMRKEVGPSMAGSLLRRSIASGDDML